MEFTRLAIVYVHLIACCVAIGLVLTSDMAMVTQLLRGDSGRHDPGHLHTLQRTVSVALLVLWITGAGLMSLDVWTQGWGVFANPKIQAKIAIVTLLTMNGLLLHRRVLPALLKAGSLLDLSLGPRALAIFAGSVSGVSWFYAAMLGVGRPLNWNYSFSALLAAYPALIAGGVASMLLLATWARYKVGKRATGEGTVPSLPRYPRPSLVNARRASRVL